MNKKEFIKKYGLTEQQYSGVEKIENDLYLRSLTSIPEGFNPTVGGYLDLGSLTSIPEGFNPTVGGDLYLRSLTSIPEGFNPTVGGGLDLRSKSNYIGAQVPELRINKNFFWLKDNKEYALIDGIFCEILTKRVHTSDGNDINLFSAKSVNKESYFFIANHNDYYAHAEDLKKAISDLQFKMVADKLKKEPINADTIISINHYRLITGACELGCKRWLEQNNLTGTEEMRADVLMPLLKKTDAYGYENFRKLAAF